MQKVSKTIWKVFLNGGRIETELDAIEWAKRGVELGAGEILLTSMNADGTKNGFEISLTRLVSEAVNVPVIASGGAGESWNISRKFFKTEKPMPRLPRAFFISGKSKFRH